MSKNLFNVEKKLVHGLKNYFKIRQGKLNMIILFLGGMDKVLLGKIIL